MYTQCPHCQTCFRIAEDHLKIANGKVRCGSCQEIFDATQHLFKNLTDREPITFNPTKKTAQPPAPPKSTQAPEPAKRDTHKLEPSVDSTARPPAQATEKTLQERKQAPDQSPFMESTIGNERYNNLDNMGSIDIPGQIDFGDSIIKFADEPVDEISQTTDSPSRLAKSEQVNTTPENNTPESTPPARTIYEDIDSKEAPVTDAEQESLKNFFAEVDAQLEDNGDKSQLDKDIDDLLAFAKGLDLDSKPEKPEDLSKPEPEEVSIPDIDISPPPDSSGIEVEEEFDMQAIADFEKELEASNPGVFSRGNKVDDAAQAELDEALSNPDSVKPEEIPVESETTTATESEPTAAADTSPTPSVDKTLNVQGEEDVPRALRHSLQMLNQDRQRSLGKTLIMSLLILILLGGLGFQVVLFRNVELAHEFPQLVPALTKVCNRIPCRYSGKVDLSQIKLLNRDVRSDPNHSNALLISATFVDKAPFDQPYPVIKITLYDLGGNVVASRRFTPKEYLQKMYSRFLLMESGTPVRITLAVLDPGKDAINFEFTFL